MRVGVLAKFKYLCGFNVQKGGVWKMDDEFGDIDDDADEDMGGDDDDF
jgi:hypothetical protein